MSIPNDLTYEKMNNMKNMIGGSFIEYLKPNIKKKENENVLKMLELTKDKPEAYLEFIAVAIFHQNFEIIKYMVEKFKITQIDTPYMKASSFFNSIIPDDSSDRINDGKDYIEIQVPFVLMSGIGGDIEIFKYLLSNKLISNLSLTGIIGLTKKYKNTFTSNIIGACAYYGKKELLEYLLENYKKDLESNVNVVTVEKKSKNGKYSLLRELAGSTPTFLAITGLSSDEKTVEILKILKNFGAKFNTNDHNKDNLLHIATKTKKINTAKYLLDELKLKNLVGESNREGYTPLSLAQHLNDDIFISYYNDKNEIDEKEIQENLKELIEDSANRVNKQSKKGKKNKKKGNLNIPSLLNSNEYQESLKVVEKNSDDENNRNKLDDLDDKKLNKKIEKKENNDDADNNQDEKEDKKDNSKEKEEDVKEKDNKSNKKSKPIPKPQSQNNPSIQNPVEEEEETIIGLGKKNKRNRRRTGGNKNKMNIGGNNENVNKEKEKEKEKEDEKEKEKEKKETGEANEGKPKNKSKKEKRVDQEEIEQEKKRKKEELERKKKEKEEEERKRKEEEEEERKRIEEEKEKELQRKREEEEKEKQREEQRKKEEQQRKREEQKRKREEKKIREEEQKKREEEERIKREEEERRRKEEEEQKRKEEEERRRKEEEEQKRKEEEERRRKEEEEEEKSEKEELSYSEEDNMGGDNSSEKEEENNIEYNEKDYEQLNKNYLELEKKMKNLEKEKEELTSCLTKLYLENKANAKVAPTSNTEENINDLMYLANKELENKNNIINDLEEKMAMLDLTNIKNFSNEKLQKYKDFYTKNLNLIKDALK